MSDDLPAFRQPPVVEVALSVAFEAMPLAPPLMGLLWDRFYKDELPHLEQVSPIRPQMERFGGSRSLGPDVRFELVQQPPPSRFWLNDQTGRNLLQLQQNWIARNWRRQEDREPYPRYPSIRAAFAADLANLRTFLRDQHLDQPKPVQCEVVYVNHIIAGDAWSDWSELSDVVQCWSDPTDRGFLPRIEEASFHAQYVIDRGSGPVGRLHVELTPGMRRSDDAKLFVLTLTARGEPTSADIDDVLSFHDIGREWIVRGFVDLTTKRMHELWERYR